jgi:hypothetical protein
LHDHLYVSCRLRKYCKWHQKQVQIGNDWRYETRLVAWYGPCDYHHSGLSLEKVSVIFNRKLLLYLTHIVE